MCAKLLESVSRLFLIGDIKYFRHWVNFEKEQMLSGICESDDVFMEYSEKGLSDLKREPRKIDKSIFYKKKVASML